MSMFRIFGVSLMALGALGFAGVAANRGMAELGGNDLSGAAVPSVLDIIIGIGLVLHHRWAAITLAIASVAAALWMGIGSIVNVPVPWLFINLGMAAAFLLPAVVVLRCWSDLKNSNRA